MFNQSAPSLVDLRDVLEHFDDYLELKGKLQHPPGTRARDRKPEGAIDRWAGQRRRRAPPGNFAFWAVRQADDDLLVGAGELELRMIKRSKRQARWSPRSSSTPRIEDLVPRSEPAPRSCPGGPTPTPPGRSGDRPSPARPASRGAAGYVGRGPRWGRSGPEGDSDAPLGRAPQRGEPHPPKTLGIERSSGVAARRVADRLRGGPDASGGARRDAAGS